MRVLAILLALALASPARASAPSGRTGGRVAGGSHGYWRVGAFAELDWSGREFSPFFSAEAREDKYSRELELLGGTWKRLTRDLQGRAGVGFALGRVKEADKSSSAAIFELGLERELPRGGFGGGYRLVSGSIGGGASPSVRGRLNTRAKERRGKAAAQAETEPEHYTYNELSGYGWVPIGKGRFLNARLTLGLPSYAGPSWTGTVGLSLPFANRVWTLAPSVSLESGPPSGIYGGLALSRRF